MARELRTVIESVQDVGGEVVVTDGSGNPPPAPDEVGPGVVWLSYPGESVFQLRDRGYKAARGEIVAITEDHVRNGRTPSAHLAATGATLINDDSIRVLHDQSLGFRGTTAIHYNAGRTMSGFKRQHMDAVQWLRVIGAPFVPAVLWLLYSQGVGQSVGYLAGPVDSPGKVQ